MMVVVTIACCATTLQTQGNCCTRSPQFNLKQENCKIAVTPIDVEHTHISTLSTTTAASASSSSSSSSKEFRVAEVCRFLVQGYHCQT